MKNQNKTKAKVYFIATETSAKIQVLQQKLEKLLKISGVLLESLSKGDNVAVKLHFGEEGNTGFVKPQYVKIILDQIRKLKARAFLIDSNTLYKGKRSDSRTHLELAREHGFIEEDLAVPIRIPDESGQDGSVSIDVKGDFIQKAKILKIVVDADAIVSIAHFKGHMMTGFGGTLKNIGMGTASREGKLKQHADVSPIVTRSKCIGCGECIEACPVEAISLIRKKAVINTKECIGCASCISVCKDSAIDVQWEQGASTILQKMAEYAKAALVGKDGKCAFLNFAIKITKECDCLAKDDPRVCPDLGILASTNPIAIDKACVDLINKRAGRDLVAELHPARDYILQLTHAAKIGMGSLDYELIKV